MGLQGAGAHPPLQQGGALQPRHRPRHPHRRGALQDQRSHHPDHTHAGEASFPRHLRKVPEIAGGHHERMDGTGYPRQLQGGR
nr:HD domain-containing phosphohydrolase [Aeromonas caviae]